jgi:hypothetical protein
MNLGTRMVAHTNDGGELNDCMTSEGAGNRYITCSPPPPNCHPTFLQRLSVMNVHTATSIQFTPVTLVTESVEFNFPFRYVNALILYSIIWHCLTKIKPQYSTAFNVVQFSSYLLMYRLNCTMVII